MGLQRNTSLEGLLFKARARVPRGGPVTMRLRRRYSGNRDYRVWSVLTPAYTTKKAISYRMDSMILRMTQMGINSGTLPGFTLFNFLSVMPTTAQVTLHQNVRVGASGSDDSQGRSQLSTTRTN